MTAGAPQTSMLYSMAWVDVSKEPATLSHPEMGDRYFTFELCMPGFGQLRLCRQAHNRR